MGKGDSRRPSFVSKEQYDKNYKAAFGKKNLLNMPEVKYACPRCGSSFWWPNDPLFGGKNRCDNCGHTWGDTNEDILKGPPVKGGFAVQKELDRRERMRSGLPR